MSLLLPAVIIAYIEANNNHETDAKLACFTPDAVVGDEGEELRGNAAIREWIETTTQKYRAMMEVTDVNTRGDETIVTAQVSGTFDGSPISLDYYFRLEGEKIAALKVK